MLPILIATVMLTGALQLPGCVGRSALGVWHTLLSLLLGCCPAREPNSSGGCCDSHLLQDNALGVGSTCRSSTSATQRVVGASPTAAATARSAVLAPVTGQGRPAAWMGVSGPVQHTPWPHLRRASSTRSPNGSSCSPCLPTAGYGGGSGACAQLPYHVSYCKDRGRHEPGCSLAAAAAAKLGPCPSICAALTPC